MKQITEDYVSFETAVLLKEKGFDELCFALYNPEEELIQCGVKLSNTQVGRVPGSYSAPTHQMVLKWLREVHDWAISIEFQVDCPTWKWRIYCIHSTKDRHTNFKHYNSYEEAVEAAIKYTLENLI